MFHSAEAFFRPRTVALVGASETGGAGWPKAIYANLESAGFPSKVYLINPRRDELWGQKVYPDFASLPEPVDLALTIVPAEFIPDVLADGVAHGLKVAMAKAQSAPPPSRRCATTRGWWCAGPTAWAPCRCART
jgi:acetyltransferase